MLYVVRASLSEYWILNIREMCLLQANGEYWRVYGVVCLLQQRVARFTLWERERTVNSERERKSNAEGRTQSKATQRNATQRNARGHGYLALARVHGCMSARTHAFWGYRVHWVHWVHNQLRRARQVAVGSLQSICVAIPCDAIP